MDTLEEIKKLKSLLDQGAISKEEYDQLKKSLFETQKDTKQTNKNSGEEFQIRTKSFKGRWIILGIVIISAIGVLAITKVNAIKHIFDVGIQNDSISNSALNPANDNVVSENGEEIGILITKTFTLDNNNNGLTFNIPKGKIWTPLYFEEESSSSDCNYIPIPKVFIDRETKTGWNKYTSFYLIDKKEFASYKLSKRNNKAVSGEICVMCVEKLCKRVTYKVYFLED